MKRSRFTEEQIIGICKSIRQGGLRPLCAASTGSRMRHLTSGARSRMEVSDARKLKALEAENRQLKKVLAEQMLDTATLKALLGKNF